MKIIVAVVGVAFLIVAGVLISLVRSGGALKPAGVIKPAEIGQNPAFIGMQIAVRLFPDFHAAQYVVWRLEEGSDALAEVPRTTIAHYRGPTKPTLHDLRNNGQDNCTENCWYILGMDAALPDSVARKTKEAATVEIFVQYFDRRVNVPEACEREKILPPHCLKPISVREVRRKIKTPARHFFMQRYLKSQFYLFIENEQ